MSSRDRFLIVSDLHLTDVEDNSDGWKAYKSSRYVVDRDFAALVKGFGMQEGRSALVLNGDIFDFDLVTAVPEQPPWPVSRAERRRGLDATEEKSAWKLRRILDDHPVFMDTLAWFLEQGHEIVYVMGNHDREFHFDAVRRVFMEALEVRCGKECASRMVFEPWFFFRSGQIYVEHGQQYDYYSSFQHLLCPTVRSHGDELLALPMGNLSNRLLMARMGFFNPHATEFIMNAFSYLVHWLKYYAFSRHGLVFNWFFGSIQSLRTLLKYRYKLRRHPPDCSQAMEDQAKRHGLSVQTLNRLVSLGKRPITDRVFRVMREFWLDRVMIALLMTGATIALALVPIPLWIKLPRW
jgi:UDP-2,3-diacylglucosamine pyrophosphatase LpxH